MPVDGVRLMYMPIHQQGEEELNIVDWQEAASRVAGHKTSAWTAYGVLKNNGIEI
jgi:hypothetical protein